MRSRLSVLQTTSLSPQSKSHSFSDTQLDSQSVCRYWTDVSDVARDFIRLCLTVDKTARPTADQLLQHPWLQAETPGVVTAEGTPKNLLPQVRKSFNAKSTWRVRFLTVRFFFLSFGSSLPTLVCYHKSPRCQQFQVAGSRDQRIPARARRSQRGVQTRRPSKWFYLLLVDETPEVEDGRFQSGSEVQSFSENS